MNYKNLLKSLPFILALLIVPATVRLSVVQLPYSIAIHWTGATVEYDLFSNTKSVLLIITAFVTGIILFFSIKKEDISHRKKYLLPILFMMVAAIISTFAFGNSDISLSGAPSRYEGLYTYISYFLLFIFASTFKMDEKSGKIIIYTVFVFTVLCFIIGFFQYIDKDLFMTKFFEKLYIPDEYASLRGTGERTNMAFKNIYGFTPHYNFLSMLMSMISLFWCCFAICSKEKKIKILSIIASCMSLFLLLGCNARSAVVAVIFALILTFTLFFNKLYKNKYTFIVAGVALVGTIFLASYTGMLSRVDSLFADMSKIFSPKTVNLEEVIPLQDVSISQDGYSVTYTGVTLKYDKKIDTYKDAEGNKLNYSKDSDGVIHFEPPYDIFTVSFVNKKSHIDNKEKSYQSVDFANTYMMFDVTEDILLVNNLGVPKDSSMLDDKITTQFDLLGSGRGYIISKTLPLLKNNLIIGYGPDSYLRVLEQDDIYRKFYVYNDPHHIVDKPHNLYLLTAINFGIPATIAFLSIVMMLFVDYKKYFKNNPIKDKNLLGVASLIGVFAYMGSGFFNDSVVSVAPYFWIFLGLAVNFITSQNEKVDTPLPKNKSKNIKKKI